LFITVVTYKFFKELNSGKNAEYVVVSEQHCRLGTPQIQLVMTTSVTFTGVSTASVIFQVIIQHSMHIVYAWNWGRGVK
jgi:hypothetical protein